MFSEFSNRLSGVWVFLKTFVYSTYLRSFSNDGGHILTKLGSNEHFWVFLCSAYKFGICEK